MSRTRVTRRIAPGVAALAASCAAVTVAACAALLSTPAGAAGVPQAPRAAAPAVVAAATPTESPCPGGEPKPCPASSKDRDQVDAGQAKVEKEEAQAEKDIADAKGQATDCPPTSKQCMTGLAGNGKDEKEGMEKAQQGLDGMHPAPADNAQSAVRGECGAFAAELPPGLASSGDPGEPTRVCELMNR